MPGKMLRFLSVVIAAVVVLSACNGGGGDDSDTITVTSLDVSELSNDTLAVSIMDYTESSNTIFLSESDLVDETVAGKESWVSINSGSPLFNSIQENDILMAGISSRYPGGFLKKVVSIIRYKDQIDLFVKDVSFTMAFRNLKMDFYKHLSFSTAAVESLDKDVQVITSGNAAIFELDLAVYDRDLDPGTTDDQIRITGTVKWKLGFGFNLVIDQWSLSTIEFTPHIKEETRISIDSDVGYDVEAEKEIAKISFPAFSVGPVIFTPFFQLTMDADGKISARSQATMEYDYDHQYAFLYDEEEVRLDNIKNRQIHYFSNDPSLSSDTRIKTALTGSLNVDIFGVSSAAFDVKEDFSLDGVFTPSYNRRCMDLSSEFNASGHICLDVFKQDNEESPEILKAPSLKHPLYSKCTDIFEFYPVAYAGPDQEVSESVTVTLDGSNSHDPDGEIETFEWRQIAGTNVQLSGKNLAKAEFIAPEVSEQEDTLIFDLTITDANGKTDTDSVEIHIKDDNETPDDPGKISGRVFHYSGDDEEQALDGVQISILKENEINDDKEPEASGMSDESGCFSIDISPGVWKAVFKKDGFIQTSYDHILVKENNEKNLGTIYLLDSSGEKEREISGNCVDSITGSDIRGVTLTLYSQLTGLRVDSTTSGLSGEFTFSDIDPGVYRIKTSGTLHIAAEFTVSTGSTTTITLEPYVSSYEEIRIALSWGPSSSNLDIHMDVPTSKGGRFHLFYPYLNTPYSERSNIQLDRDATPPNGIETVTIRNRFNGSYIFMVHDFTNQSSLNSFDLSRSNAVVKVYRGFEEVRRFSVPLNTEGNFWEVFRLEGETGQISPLNKMSYEDVTSIVNRFGGEFPNNN